MKHFQKFALILSALILTQTVACGGETTPKVTPEDGTTTIEPTETTSPLDARKAVEDGLPDRKFDGREFVVLTYDSLTPNIFIEAETGDVIDDAVYKRNRTVEERFDVKISVLEKNPYYESVNFARKTVMANEDVFQLCDTHVVSLGGSVTSDIWINWYDVDFVDFTKPWWSKSTREDLTYNGKAYLAVGDFSLSALSGTYCYYYDKKSAADWGVTGLYEAVHDGKWTVDYVRNIVKDIYKDLNGNGTKDGDDFYGLTFGPRSPVNAYLWAFGGKIYNKKADGSLEFVYKSENTVNIVEKLYALMYESDGVDCFRGVDYGDESKVHAIATDVFMNNKALFVSGSFSTAINYFRFRDDDYGILPYPKYDENQAEYKTMVDGSHGAQAVPKTVSDLEFVGIVTEALNAESYKQVTPAFYDVALKVKYTSDLESAEIIDTIVENRVFDFGYVYDNFKGVSFIFQRLLGRDKSKDFESTYASTAPAALEYYQTIIDYFEK